VGELRGDGIGNPLDVLDMNNVGTAHSWDDPRLSRSGLRGAAGWAGDSRSLGNLAVGAAVAPTAWESLQAEDEILADAGADLQAPLTSPSQLLNPLRGMSATIRGYKPRVGVARPQDTALNDFLRKQRGMR